MQLPAPSRSLAATGLLLPLLALTATAQDGPPQPAKEMQRLTPLVGLFSGGGTASDPSGNEAEWSAKVQGRLVLGGFFLETLTTIEVGVDVPIQLRSLMGWDAENQRFVSFGYGNNGAPQGLIEPYWANKNTFVEPSVTRKEGKTVLSRSIWTISDDGFEMRVDEAWGTEPMQTMVSGSFEKKSDDAGEFDYVDEVFPYGESPDSSMRDLKKLTGDFDGNGWMIMPGVGRMDLKGRDTITMRAGGFACEFHPRAVAGSGGPEWEGWQWVTWDQHTETYRLAMFSNFGEVSTVAMEWLDDGQLLSYGANRYMGMPMLGRSILTVGKNGPETVDAHSMHGAGTPEHSFHMNYTRRTGD